MRKIWMLVLVIFLVAGLCFNGDTAGKVKYESESNDAGSTVLYGTPDAGDTIVRIKTAADGSIVTDASGKYVLLSDTFETLTVNSTTPAVTAGDRFITANTNPTSITNFTGGQVGEEITINFTDNNTTIVNGATIVLQSVGNFVPVAGNTIKLILRGTTWYEIGRLGAGSVESDTLATVTGRGATTTVSSSFQNATALVIGKDETGGTPNIVGSTKWFSAGDNAYYTTITAGTNTSNFAITLPVDEPLGTYLLNMTSGGVIGYDSSVYLTAEADTLQTVTTRGATTTTNIASTNVLAFTAGQDVSGGTTNVPGQIKLWSNGDNAYYNTFTAGTNTANATYTLPVAMPAGDYLLQSSNTGVMSWVAGAMPSAHNILSASHGDTVAASPVLGDIMYGDASPKWTKLAGNTTVIPQKLTSTGTGAVSAVPAWKDDYEEIDFCINDPSSIAAIRTIFHVDTKKYPNGIKLVNVQFTVPIKKAYTLVYEEWTNSAEVITKVSDIESVSTDANHIYAEVEGANIDDSDIATDNYIRITIPATASDEVHGKIIFYAK